MRQNLRNNAESMREFFDIMRKIGKTKPHEKISAFNGIFKPYNLKCMPYNILSPTSLPAYSLTEFLYAC